MGHKGEQVHDGCTISAVVNLEKRMSIANRFTHCKCSSDHNTLTPV